MSLAQSFSLDACEMKFLKIFPRGNEKVCPGGHNAAGRVSQLTSFLPLPPLRHTHNLASRFQKTSQPNSVIVNITHTPRCPFDFLSPKRNSYSCYLSLSLCFSLFFFLLDSCHLRAQLQRTENSASRAASSARSVASKQARA